MNLKKSCMFIYIYYIYVCAWGPDFELMDLKLFSFSKFSCSTRKRKQTPDCSAIKVDVPAVIRLWIYKTTTATDFKAPLKLLCHSDLSRHEDGCPAQQRAELKRGSCSPLAIDQRASVSGRRLHFSAGKNNVELLSWQNDRGRFNHFPSRISEVSAHLLS